MNKDDKVKLYEAIRNIAKNLCTEEQVYQRSDLADELNEYGINGDSIEVSKLVFEAYHYFNEDRNIEYAFVTNDNRTALIKEYEFANLLDKNKPDDAITYMKDELSKTSSGLSRLSKDIELNASVTAAKTISGFFNVITGNIGAKAIRSKAAKLFEDYSNMVDTYHDNEDAVRNIIKDFEDLRTYIDNTYKEIAMRLIDIYGDSIKATDPKLFDFGQVTYLDVDSMFQNTKLEYDELTKNCTELIGSISKDFQKAVRNSANAYKLASKRNKESLGLVLAGLEMFNHYSDAVEKSSILGSQLVNFKKSIKKDTTLVKADSSRLFIIYKTLNDIIIPKAVIYSRYATQLMNSDIKAIMKSLYDDQEVKPLFTKRQELLRKIKAWKLVINDRNMNINKYEENIQKLDDLLHSNAEKYNTAKSSEPSKPFLLNILTLGYAGKRFSRKYSEWYSEYSQFVREYELNEDNLDYYKGELSSHQSAVKEGKTELDDLLKQFELVSEEIHTKVQASHEVQMKMLPHLRTIIGMLRLGREIAESKLDKNLLNTVSIPDFTDSTKLPADIEDNINIFTSTITASIQVESDDASKLLKKIEKKGSLKCTDKSDDKTDANKNCSDEEKSKLKEEEEKKDKAKVANASNVALQHATSMFNSALKLQKDRLEGKLASAAYDEELRKIADDFSKQIKDIDDKSAFVREIMRHVNLAANEDDRKHALLMLGKLSNQQLTEQDFQDFISGKRTIEL